MIRRIPLNVNPSLSFEVSNMLSNRSNLIFGIEICQSIKCNINHSLLRFLWCVSRHLRSIPADTSSGNTCESPSHKGERNRTIVIYKMSPITIKITTIKTAATKDTMIHPSLHLRRPFSLLSVYCVFLLRFVVVFAVVVVVVCVHCAVCTRSKKGRKMLKCNKF